MLIDKMPSTALIDSQCKKTPATHKDGQAETGRDGVSAHVVVTVYIGSQVQQPLRQHGCVMLRQRSFERALRRYGDTEM